MDPPSSSAGPRKHVALEFEDDDVARRALFAYKAPATSLTAGASAPAGTIGPSSGRSDWDAPARRVDAAGAAVELATCRPPPGVERVLLHSCCAPCSGAMIEEMQASGVEMAVFFYNPNIHPRKEYEIRKQENKRYAEKLGIPFIDCDYDSDRWFERARGMEYDPERGARCTMCFDMRLERTALYASEHGFQAFTTTNATSRWKDVAQVNASGVKAAARYDNLRYWVYDWQTDGMTLRKYNISAAESFYKQEYCGCVYSLRDSNTWRKEQGMEPIKIGGESFYHDPEADAAEESQHVVDAFFSRFPKAEGGAPCSAASLF